MEQNIYRIIDANFNRAREAARVMEEFCRFALNSALFTKRAKQLRHSLSAVVNTLDAARLIGSRDTLGDVGVGQTVDEQMNRTDLKDCMIAACKRLTEALRALAEMSRALNSSVADEIDRLRYAAYSLEKDIVLFSDTAEKFKPVRLYVIVSSNLPAEILSLTSLCAAGGADCIQLRAKDIRDDRLFAVAVEFVKICRDGGVVSIINDRVDIAVAAGSDGVHLGQDDLPVEYARKIALTPLIIGKSTHSLEQLQKTCEQMPTYVSLGPVFASPTKPGLEAVGLDYVKRAAKILADKGIIGVAVGGINSDNIEHLLSAGIKTVAVCSSVTGSTNPVETCRLLKMKIEASGK